MNKIENIRQAFEEGRKQEDERTRWAAKWWFEELQHASEHAEEEATLAYVIAKSGDFGKALTHARKACQIELAIYGDCATWTPLRQAVEAALSNGAGPGYSKMTDEAYLSSAL